MKLIELLAALLLTLGLFKVTAMGILILLMWVKGQKISLHTEEWDSYFKKVNVKTLLHILMAVYSIAAVLTISVSYASLKLLGFHYSFKLAVIILLIRVCYMIRKIRNSRYHKKQKD